MNQLVTIATVVVTLIPAFLHPVIGIDLDTTKESACFPIKSVPVDMEWIKSRENKLWYTPVLTRYDLYQMATDLAGKDPSNIREDEVYYGACIVSWVAEGKSYFRGFNKTLFYDVQMIRDLEEYYWEVKAEGAKMKGVSYTSLTDNKTFIFIPSCLDGQMTWGVSSTIKRLPEETTQTIFEHAESLGFKRVYFTGLRYDSCPEDYDKYQEKSNKEL